MDRLDALLTPPLIGRGEPYRARCIGLFERHAEHHLSYGRPFPPKYKDVFADRGATAGELGSRRQAQPEHDIVIVPMAGASYALHGIKFYPMPLLMNTDAGTPLRPCAVPQTFMRGISAALSHLVTTPWATATARRTAAAHRSCWQYRRAGGRTRRPVRVRQRVGHAVSRHRPARDRRRCDAVQHGQGDRAPTSGLVIGREDAMVNVRRAFGIHGDRFGATSRTARPAMLPPIPGKMAMTGCWRRCVCCAISRRSSRSRSTRRTRWCSTNMQGRRVIWATES